MKHIILTSILLCSTAVLAQSDRKPWQRLDGDIYNQNPSNPKPPQTTVQGQQNDPDHWEGRRGYMRRYSDNFAMSSHSDRPIIYNYYTAKQIKICHFAGDFMRIKTPNSEQVFNFTLYESQIVTVSNTQIKLKVTEDGSWEVVNEDQAYLFEEIECE